MKKFYYPLFALATMAMTNTSCQDEAVEHGVTESNEVAVSFDVQLENAVGSRAVGDGTSAENLFYAVYKATDANALGSEITGLTGKGTKVESKKFTVTTRLVKGQTYNFIFWAQSEDKKDGTYYNVTDLSKIVVKYNDDATTTEKEHTIAANNEARDAFYAVRKNLKVTGPITETITLKRPFGQINVGTSIGSLAGATTAGTTVARSKMVVCEVATELYPYSGQVGGKAENVEYTIAAIPEQTKDDQEGELTDVADEDYEYLSMNYILVNDQTADESQVVTGARKNMLNKVHFYIYDESSNTPVNDFEIPNVPVQRNWRTNIIGDILNSNVTFNIVIDPTFDKDEDGNDHNYYTTVYTAADLLEAVADGARGVLLQNNLVLDETLEIGHQMILNLNGKSLTNKTGNTKTDVIVVKPEGDLTINGDGTVEAVSGNDGYTIISEGTLTINGGVYKSGLDADNDGNCTIYARGNGKIYINGGQFSTPAGDNTTYVVNKKDADEKTAIIEIKGGKFTNFDPAGTGYDPSGSKYVADGYESENIGTAAAPVYQVVKITTP